MKLIDFFKHLKRRFLVLGFIALALVILFLIPKGNQKPNTEFATVKRQDITSTVSTSGNLIGKRTVDLHFKVSGKLAFLNVSSADIVHEGQIIAGLDTQDLSISLQQAENTLRDKQTALEKALDDIHLFQYGNGGFGNVGSQNETELQKQTRTSAEVAKDNAVDSLRAAQRAFSDTVITAPFSGLIIKADFAPRQVVGTTDTIVELVDDSTYFVDVDIDEADIGKVSVGQKANVSLDAYPNQVIPGVLEEIKPTTKTTSSGATVVTVRVNIGKPAINFVSGLSGQVSIITAGAKNVLVIPQEALGENNTVLVKRGSEIKPQKVTTGITSDTDVEIKDGLKEGDKVVTNPADFSKNSGQRGIGVVFRFFRGGR